MPYQLAIGGLFRCCVGSVWAELDRREDEGVEMPKEGEVFETTCCKRPIVCDEGELLRWDHEGKGSGGI